MAVKKQKSMYFECRRILIECVEKKEPKENETKRITWSC